MEIQSLMRTAVGAVFILISVAPLAFNENEDSSYIKQSKSIFPWLLASILVNGCLITNYISVKREHVLERWKSILILLTAFTFSDIILLISGQHKLHASNALFNSLNIVKLVGVAVSILYTNIFSLFPDDYSKYIKSASSLSLILVTVGQAFEFTSHIIDDKTSSIFHFVALSCDSLAAIIFVGLCINLFHPLWSIVNDDTFQAIELQTDFLRIVVLSVYLFTSAILHFTVHGEAVLTNFVLQISLAYFLNLLPTREYQKIIEKKEIKFQEKIDMTRYISHEMRTPLNSAAIGLAMGLDIISDIKKALINMSEVASRRDNTSVEVDQLENFIKLATDEELTIMQIQDSCAVAVATLDDILTFDKLSEGKLTAEFQDLDPWQFLSHSAKPLHFNASEKEVNLQIICAEEHFSTISNSFIKGDPFKLAQVIRNLISNALKFTPAKSTVEVKLDYLSGSNLQPLDLEAGNQQDSSINHQDFIRISVKDAGIGISEENQRKLFCQYVQIKPGEQQGGKGSGLGLWISKKIVELHEGRIGVISAGEGSGSTFFVDLPVFHVSTQKKGLSMILKTSFLMYSADSKTNNPTHFNHDTPVKRLSAVFHMNRITPMFELPLPDLSAAKSELSMNSSENSSLRIPETTYNYNMSELNLPVILTNFAQNNINETVRSWDSGLNFLIVDDAVSNRKLLKRALERHGHQVELAEDGVECIEFIEKRLNSNHMIKDNKEMKNDEKEENKDKLPDVILMDDSMPRMTGVKATGKLRKMGFKGLIYGATGDVDPEKHNKFMDKGANGVFSKPLNLVELKNCLDEKLN